MKVDQVSDKELTLHINEALETDQRRRSWFEGNVRRNSSAQAGHLR